MSDPALSPAAAMATQPVAVPPDSHAFVGKLTCILSIFILPLPYPCLAFILSL